MSAPPIPLPAPPGPGGRAARRWPLAAACLAAALLTALTLATLPMQTDLLAMLGARDPGLHRLAGLMARSHATLVLAAVSPAAPGDDPTGTADRLAELLVHTPGVAFATNGRSGLDANALALLFDHRYLLAPAGPATDFSPASLRAGLDRLLGRLAGPEAPLAERFGLPDPTGAFPAVLQRWAGGEAGGEAGGGGGGAFTDAGGRALLLIGLTQGQTLGDASVAASLASISAAFAGLRAPGQNLTLAGPAVLAAAAGAAVARDVRLISIASSLAIAALLVWRFRSPLVLAAIAVPVLLAFDIAAWATVLRFGSLDALALGFGATMLGITVDYPVLLIGHRKRHEPPAGTLGRIGGTFLVAVATAATGLSGMAFSTIRPVAELGTFAVAGLLAAAFVTYFLLPPLVAASGLGPVGAGDPRLLHRVEAARRLRPAGLALLALAAALLGWRGVALAPDLARLAPVPPRLLAEDTALRTALGAAEPGDIALLTAPTAEAVLQREEALAPSLAALARRGVIGGASLAAGLLPSLAAQRARQASLPDRPTLAAALEAAGAGLPFRPAAFAPFQEAVAAARAAPPLGPAEITPPLLAFRLGMMLVPPRGAETGWSGLITFTRVADAAALGAALGEAGVDFLDIATATRQLAEAAIANARHLLAASAAAALLALLACLREPRRVLRIALAVAAALLATTALTVLASGPLSVVQLVALQFVGGIATHYALFFSRGPIDAEERARTLRTLLTCAGAALIAFGLLILCRTPLLHQLGLTVAFGVACSLVFAFLLSRPTRVLAG